MHRADFERVSGCSSGVGKSLNAFSRSIISILGAQIQLIDGFLEVADPE